MELQGQVSLVTGAQQGIGAAGAIALAAAGSDVAVHWFDDQAGAGMTAAAVEALGRRAVLIQADLAQPGAPQALVAEAVAALGPLDIMVNNAGIFPRVPFLDMTEADWSAVLDLNLRATCFGAQAAARAMILAGRRGAIVNLSSITIRGTRHGVHYSASKGGIAAATRGMALELAPHGIRVNALAPGVTDTAQPRDGMTPEEFDALAQAIPLGRVATPPEIADAIVFLASPRSSFVTGQVLHVNGGGFMPA